MTIEIIKELTSEDIKLWKELYKEDLEQHESSKLTYKQRQNLPDSDFAVVITVKKKRGKGVRKIRMFPIENEAHIRNALARLGQTKVQQTLMNLGVSIKKVTNKVLARAKKLGMTELIKRHSSISTPEEIVEKLQLEIKKSEAAVEDAKKEITNLEKEKSEMDAKLKQLEAEKEQKEKEIELYKEQAKTIIARRSELEDFAKDSTDEQLLDDTYYELLKLRKENAELRAKNSDLNTGHTEDSQDDEISNLRKRVFESKQY